MIERFSRPMFLLLTWATRLCSGSHAVTVVKAKEMFEVTEEEGGCEALVVPWEAYEHGVSRGGRALQVLGGTFHWSSGLENFGCCSVTQYSMRAAT